MSDNGSPTFQTGWCFLFHVSIWKWQKLNLELPVYKARALPLSDSLSPQTSVYLFVIWFLYKIKWNSGVKISYANKIKRLEKFIFSFRSPHPQIQRVGPWLTSYQFCSTKWHQYWPSPSKPGLNCSSKVVPNFSICLKIHGSNLHRLCRQPKHPCPT